MLGSGNSGTVDWTDDDAGANDWNSWIDAYLSVVGTAPSDFGPAKVAIEIYGYDYQEAQNGVLAPDANLGLDHAYISVGDGTVLTAGLVEDSNCNEDEDSAFGWLPSVISDETDGVDFDGGPGNYEGHVIQLTSKVADGLTAGVALEDLNGTGSLVGVYSYANEGLSAHVSVLAGTVLNGTFNELAMYTGFTAVIDAVRARGAFAANDSGWWNALASTEATLDMFTLAATVDGTSARELGLVGSASAKLNGSFTVKLAARYLDADVNIANDQGTEVRGRVEYTATETITLAAEAGHLLTGAAAPSGT